jgi:hypothetical protein
MELSKPVQVWFSFPPVHAEHSSLVTRVIPPMRGARGLLELEGAASSGWGSHWSWKLQDRLFIGSESPGLSDCFGEANVKRIGDPKSFWIAAAFDGSPKDSNNRFIWKVRRRRGAFR